MARPESEPKTPLGRRLRSVRRHFGVEQRELFAKSLGISKDALAMYERGENVPSATVLAAYRETFGVNMNWLVTGQGEMFEDTSKSPPLDFIPALMEKLGRIVTAVHRDAHIRIAPEKVVYETAELYKELCRRVADLTDEEEIEATLPQLRHLLKKRLAEAAAEPGSGKRTA